MTDIPLGWKVIAVTYAAAALGVSLSAWAVQVLWDRHCIKNLDQFNRIMGAHSG